MPSLGADIEVGTIVEWRVRPGDRVKRGDVVAMIETEKGLVEVEIWQAGVIESIVMREGQKVPVGTVLALLRSDGAPAKAPEPVPAPVVAAKPPPPPAVPSTPKIVPPTPAIAVAAAGRQRVSPVARRLAAELGVDLATVTGSGDHGAITKQDVERAAQRVAPPPPAVAPLQATVTTADRQAAMRKVIAAAMSRSKREIPHYYLGTHIDMSRATTWLAAENLKRAVPDRLLYSALLIKAVALAVCEAPEMNGFWIDGGFKPGAGVHVGVAISLRQGGLVAPAIHDVDTLRLNDLMRRMLDLVQRARTGVLRSSEIADATITVTNLGGQGVETVFGIIYPPQVALVGFGKLSEQPWAAGGMIGARPVIAAALSADHRASDGHRGGRFLAAIDRRLQEPETL